MTQSNQNSATNRKLILDSTSRQVNILDHFFDCASTAGFVLQGGTEVSTPLRATTTIVLEGTRGTTYYRVLPCNVQQISLGESTSLLEQSNAAAAWTADRQHQTAD